MSWVSQKSSPVLRARVARVMRKKEWVGAIADGSGRRETVRVRENERERERDNGNRRQLDVEKERDENPRGQLGF